MSIELEFLIPFLGLTLLVSVAVISLRKAIYNLPPLTRNSLFDILANLESGRIMEIYSEEEQGFEPGVPNKDTPTASLHCGNRCIASTACF